VVVFTVAIGCDPCLARAHLNFCARAIFNRDALDIKRLGADEDADADVIGWFGCRDVPVPFNDSMTVIALSNFSTCNCATRRSARSCWSAFAKFPIGSFPLVFDNDTDCRGLGVLMPSWTRLPENSSFGSVNCLTGVT